MIDQLSLLGTSDELLRLYTWAHHNLWPRFPLRPSINAAALLCCPLEGVRSIFSVWVPALSSNYLLHRIYILHRASHGAHTAEA